MSISRRHFLGGTAASVPTLGLLSAPVQAAEESKRPEQPGKTPNTKFAVNVEMWWRKLPFLDRLEAAAKLGFPAVEFWPWRGKNTNAIADTCERLGLEVAQFTAWGFKPGLNDPKNHNRFVEEIEASCETAKQLHCKLMTVVGGDDIQGLSQEQMHENIVDGLNKAAPIAEKHQITLILEPMNIRVDHKGHCLYGSAPTVRIINAVGSKFVKINYDLYHMQITEGDLCGHLRESKDAIGYVQLADHPGRNEPGTGEIHYPRVLKEVKAIGYTGLVGLECRPKGSEEDAAFAVWQADQWS